LGIDTLIANILVNYYSYEILRNQGLYRPIGANRVVHGLGWPIGWVGLGQDFSVFGGLSWVGWIHYSQNAKKNKKYVTTRL